MGWVPTKIAILRSAKARSLVAAFLLGVILQPGVTRAQGTFTFPGIDLTDRNACSCSKSGVDDFLAQGAANEQKASARDQVSTGNQNFSIPIGQFPKNPSGNAIWVGGSLNIQGAASMDAKAEKWDPNDPNGTLLNGQGGSSDNRVKQLLRRGSSLKSDYGITLWGAVGSKDKSFRFPVLEFKSGYDFKGMAQTTDQTEKREMTKRILLFGITIDIWANLFKGAQMASGALGAGSFSQAANEALKQSVEQAKDFARAQAEAEINGYIKDPNVRVRVGGAGSASPVSGLNGGAPDESCSNDWNGPWQFRMDLKDIQNMMTGGAASASPVSLDRILIWTPPDIFIEIRAGFYARLALTVEMKVSTPGVNSTMSLNGLIEKLKSGNACAPDSKALRRQLWGDFKSGLSPLLRSAVGSAENLYGAGARVAEAVRAYRKACESAKNQYRTLGQSFDCSKNKRVQTAGGATDPAISFDDLSCSEKAAIISDSTGEEREINYQLADARDRRTQAWSDLGVQTATTAMEYFQVDPKTFSIRTKESVRKEFDALIDEWDKNPYFRLGLGARVTGDVSVWFGAGVGIGLGPISVSVGVIGTVQLINLEAGSAITFDSRESRYLDVDGNYEWVLLTGKVEVYAKGEAMGVSIEYRAPLITFDDRGATFGSFLASLNQAPPTRKDLGEQQVAIGDLVIPAAKWSPTPPDTWRRVKRETKLFRIDLARLWKDASGALVDGGSVSRDFIVPCWNLTTSPESVDSRCFPSNLPAGDRALTEAHAKVKQAYVDSSTPANTLEEKNCAIEIGTGFLTGVKASNAGDCTGLISALNILLLVPADQDIPGVDPRIALIRQEYLSYCSSHPTSCFATHSGNASNKFILPIRASFEMTADGQLRYRSNGDPPPYFGQRSLDLEIEIPGVSSVAFQMGPAPTLASSLSCSSSPDSPCHSASQSFRRPSYAPIASEVYRPAFSYNPATAAQLPGSLLLPQPAQVLAIDLVSRNPSSATPDSRDFDKEVLPIQPGFSSAKRTYGVGPDQNGADSLIAVSELPKVDPGTARKRIRPEEPDVHRVFPEDLMINLSELEDVSQFFPNMQTFGMSSNQTPDRTRYVEVGHLSLLNDAELLKLALSAKLGECRVDWYPEKGFELFNDHQILSGRPDSSVKSSGLQISVGGQAWPEGGDPEGRVILNLIQGRGGVRISDQLWTLNGGSSRGNLDTLGRAFTVASSIPDSRELWAREGRYAAAQLRAALLGGECFPSDRLRFLTALSSISNAELWDYFEGGKITGAALDITNTVEHVDRRKQEYPGEGGNPDGFCTKDGNSGTYYPFGENYKKRDCAFQACIPFTNNCWCASWSEYASCDSQATGTGFGHHENSAHPDAMRRVVVGCEIGIVSDGNTNRRAPGYLNQISFTTPVTQRKIHSNGSNRGRYFTVTGDQGAQASGHLDDFWQNPYGTTSNPIWSQNFFSPRLVYMQKVDCNGLKPDLTVPDVFLGYGTGYPSNLNSFSQDDRFFEYIADKYGMNTVSTNRNNLLLGDGSEFWQPLRNEPFGTASISSPNEFNRGTQIDKTLQVARADTTLKVRYGKQLRDCLNLGNCGLDAGQQSLLTGVISDTFEKMVSIFSGTSNRANLADQKPASSGVCRLQLKGQKTQDLPDRSGQVLRDAKDLNDCVMGLNDQVQRDVCSRPEVLAVVDQTGPTWVVPNVSGYFEIQANLTPRNGFSDFLSSSSQSRTLGRCLYEYDGAAGRLSSAVIGDFIDDRTKLTPLANATTCTLKFKTGGVIASAAEIQKVQTVKGSGQTDAEACVQALGLVATGTGSYVFDRGTMIPNQTLRTALGSACSVRSSRTDVETFPLIVDIQPPTGSLIPAALTASVAIDWRERFTLNPLQCAAVPQCQLVLSPNASHPNLNVLGLSGAPPRQMVSFSPDGTGTAQAVCERAAKGSFGSPQANLTCDRLVQQPLFAAFRKPGAATAGNYTTTVQLQWKADASQAWVGGTSILCNQRAPSGAGTLVSGWFGSVNCVSVAGISFCNQSSDYSEVPYVKSFTTNNPDLNATVPVKVLNLGAQSPVTLNVNSVLVEALTWIPDSIKRKKAAQRPAALGMLQFCKKNALDPSDCYKDSRNHFYPVSPGAPGVNNFFKYVPASRCSRIDANGASLDGPIEWELAIEGLEGLNSYRQSQFQVCANDLARQSVRSPASDGPRALLAVRGAFAAPITLASSAAMRSEYFRDGVFGPKFNLIRQGQVASVNLMLQPDNIAATCALAKARLYEQDGYSGDVSLYLADVGSEGMVKLPLSADQSSLTAGANSVCRGDRLSVCKMRVKSSSGIEEIIDFSQSNVFTSTPGRATRFEDCEQEIKSLSVCALRDRFERIPLGESFTVNGILEEQTAGYSAGVGFGQATAPGAAIEKPVMVGFDGSNQCSGVMTEERCVAGTQDITSFLPLDLASGWREGWADAGLGISTVPVSSGLYRASAIRGHSWESCLAETKRTLDAAFDSQSTVDSAMQAYSAVLTYDARVRATACASTVYIEDNSGFLSQGPNVAVSVQSDARIRFGARELNLGACHRTPSVRIVGATSPVGTLGPVPILEFSPAAESGFMEAQWSNDPLCATGFSPLQVSAVAFQANLDQIAPGTTGCVRVRHVGAILERYFSPWRALKVARPGLCQMVASYGAPIGDVDLSTRFPGEKVWAEDASKCPLFGNFCDPLNDLGLVPPPPKLLDVDLRFSGTSVRKDVCKGRTNQDDNGKRCRFGFVSRNQWFKSNGQAGDFAEDRPRKAGPDQFHDSNESFEDVLARIEPAWRYKPLEDLVLNQQDHRIGCEWIQDLLKNQFRNKTVCGALTPRAVNLGSGFDPALWENGWYPALRFAHSSSNSSVPSALIGADCVPPLRADPGTNGLFRLTRDPEQLNPANSGGFITVGLAGDSSTRFSVEVQWCNQNPCSQWQPLSMPSVPSGSRFIDLNPGSLLGNSFTAQTRFRARLTRTTGVAPFDPAFKLADSLSPWNFWANSSTGTPEPVQPAVESRKAVTEPVNGAAPADTIETAPVEQLNIQQMNPAEENLLE